jgi:hypothetical protein
MGRHRPPGCTCMFVHHNPENPDERTGIAVARSCLMHGNKLDGFMWHPAHGCECIITQHKNGKVVTNDRKCPHHKTPMLLPVTKTVMK